MCYYKKLFVLFFYLNLIIMKVFLNKVNFIYFFLISLLVNCSNYKENYSQYCNFKEEKLICDDKTFKIINDRKVLYDNCENFQYIINKNNRNKTYYGTKCFIKNEWIIIE